MLEALTNHTANDKSSHSSYNARLPTAFFSLSSDPTNPYQRLSLVYMIKGGLVRLSNCNWYLQYSLFSPSCPFPSLFSYCL